MNSIRIKVLIIMSILLYRCSSSEQKLSEYSSIIGNWKMVEAYISAGGPQYWIDVENGSEYSFFNDRTFVSGEYFGCTSGKFQIVSNELNLAYDCNEAKEKLKNSNGVTSYNFSFDDDGFLLLIPTTIMCVEGCTYRFRKIDNQN